MSRNKSFETRAEEFKNKVMSLLKELEVELSVGYLNSMDDDDLIICDVNSDKKVYFNTLTQEER